VLEATADSNIYISALHFHFLNQARARAFRLAISPPLLAEIRRVLGDKFQWTPDPLDDAFPRLVRFTTLVQSSQVIDAVPDDPDGNRVLKCAVAAKSSHIVTGDGDLERYDGIQVVRVADFLKLMPA
jgi:predicted nucleic acid-binding protein